jgi:hypothetical protein
MSANEKTVDVAATTTTAVNNEQAVQTSNPTGSTATATKPHRPLVFHAQVRKDDPNTVHALCGITWPRRRAISTRQAPGEPGAFCDDCSNLGRLNHDLGGGES